VHPWCCMDRRLRCVRTAMRRGLPMAWPSGADGCRPGALGLARERSRDACEPRTARRMATRPASGCWRSLACRSSSYAIPVPCRPVGYRIARVPACAGGPRSDHRRDVHTCDAVATKADRHAEVAPREGIGKGPYDQRADWQNAAQARATVDGGISWRQPAPNARMRPPVAIARSAGQGFGAAQPRRTAASWRRREAALSRASTMAESDDRASRKNWYAVQARDVRAAYCTVQSNRVSISLASSILAPCSGASRTLRAAAAQRCSAGCARFASLTRPARGASGVELSRWTRGEQGDDRWNYESTRRWSRCCGG
jgi:hypothetical protein